MSTIIGIAACGFALGSAWWSRLHKRRLERVLISQQEQILHLALYAHIAQEHILELMKDMHTLQDTLSGDYPELITPPEPDYPAAYDQWGEFDV